MKIKRELITVSGLLCSALMLSGCNEAAPDPKTQVARNPIYRRCSNISSRRCVWHRSSVGKAVKNRALAAAVDCLAVRSCDPLSLLPGPAGGAMAMQAPRKLPTAIGNAPSAGSGAHDIYAVIVSDGALSSRL